MKHRCLLILFIILTGVALFQTPKVLAQLAVITQPQNAIKETRPPDSEQDPQLSQDSITFTAIPPRTENLTIKPGESLQTTVRLKNISPTTQQAHTEVVDYIVGQDGKTPIAITAQEAAPLRWSLASWITVSPTSTTIAPNQSATYDLLIQVPKDAMPGGHYAIVLHSPEKPGSSLTETNTTSNSASAINQRVGTLVYVTVPGNIQENALIRNFSAPTWVEYGPVPFSFSVENLSDVHITPQSSITIKNLFGKTVDTLTVDQLNIFPYTSRSFETTLRKVWGLGPYWATLRVPYGSTGKLVSATLIFWMIPYKILFAIAVVLATLLVLSIAVRRHLLHKGDVRTQHIEVLEERIQKLEKELKNRE